MKRRFLTFILLGLLLMLDIGGWKVHLSAQTPETAYQLESKGEAAYRQGQWSQAITQWTEALESY